MHTIIRVSSLLLLTFLVGCQSVPSDAMQLQPASLEKRQLQSKKYDTLDEAGVLSASMEVLQDMGFIINEAESKLGVIVGSKIRETENRIQRVALITLSILANTESFKGIEKEHTIKVSLVTTPDKKTKSTTVRVNFQREVKDMENQIVKRESLNQQDLYTGFFAKLSKSVFLEAHEI